MRLNVGALADALGGDAALAAAVTQRGLPRTRHAAHKWRVRSTMSGIALACALLELHAHGIDLPSYLGTLITDEPLHGGRIQDERQMEMPAV